MGHRQKVDLSPGRPRRAVIAPCPELIIVLGDKNVLFVLISGDRRARRLILPSSYPYLVAFYLFLLLYRHFPLNA